jgi:hypothetical protein
MISERTFARSFASFWDELLPLLTPSFVHIISEVYKERLTDDFGFMLDPIPRRADADSAVIAEFAFYLTKSAMEAGMTIKAAYDDERIRNEAFKTAALVVSYYEGAVQYPRTDLREDESLEGFEIAQNYRYFFEQVPVKGTIEFLPRIRGAGFLQNCQADLAIGPALFEVKTVNRNLASKDIRQLIIYLALQAATGERKWSWGGFFNPRKAEYRQFAVDEVLAQVSGGRSSSEVYHFLIDFVSSSDVQFDTAF